MTLKGLCTIRKPLFIYEYQEVQPCSNSVIRLAIWKVRFEFYLPKYFSDHIYCPNRLNMLMVYGPTSSDSMMALMPSCLWPRKITVIFDSVHLGTSVPSLPTS